MIPYRPSIGDTVRISEYLIEVHMIDPNKKWVAGLQDEQFVLVPYHAVEPCELHPEIQEKLERMNENRLDSLERD